MAARGRVGHGRRARHWARGDPSVTPDTGDVAGAAVLAAAAVGVDGGASVTPGSCGSGGGWVIDDGRGGGRGVTSPSHVTPPARRASVFAASAVGVDGGPPIPISTLALIALTCMLPGLYPAVSRAVVGSTRSAALVARTLLLYSSHRGAALASTVVLWFLLLVGGASRRAACVSAGGGRGGSGGGIGGVGAAAAPADSAVCVVLTL